jgi:hypothetical protein
VRSTSVIQVPNPDSIDAEAPGHREEDFPGLDPGMAGATGSHRGQKGEEPKVRFCVMKNLMGSRGMRAFLRKYRGVSKTYLQGYLNFLIFLLNERGGWLAFLFSDHLRI